MSHDGPPHSLTHSLTPPTRHRPGPYKSFETSRIYLNSARGLSHTISLGLSSCVQPSRPPRSLGKTGSRWLPIYTFHVICTPPLQAKGSSIIHAFIPPNLMCSSEQSNLWPHSNNVYIHFSHLSPTMPLWAGSRVKRHTIVTNYVTRG